MVPFILIGFLRSWTADDLFNLIDDEDSWLVLLLDIVSEYSDPEACSAGCFAGCFAGLGLRKRSSAKIREGKPPR